MTDLMLEHLPWEGLSGQGDHTGTRKNCIQFLMEQSPTSFLQLNHFNRRVLQFPVWAGWIRFPPASKEQNHQKLYKSRVFWYHKNEDKDQGPIEPDCFLWNALVTWKYRVDNYHKRKMQLISWCIWALCTRKVFLKCEKLLNIVKGRNIFIRNMVFIEFHIFTFLGRHIV